MGCPPQEGQRELEVSDILSPLIFTSEAAGSRTQTPRIAAVKAVRQCAQNQKLKIPTNTSRTRIEAATEG